MAELTFQEKLQPSLLDRLIDDAPNEKQESREQRVMSIRKLREVVLRDIRWLLNCTNISSTIDLRLYPHVATSVLNYGMPALGGATVAGLDAGELEQQLRGVIAAFEPRILRDTLRVRATAAPDVMTAHAVIFEIEGELWAQPASQRILFRTAFDLELSEVKVNDQTTGRER